jgi:hypothetical protein
MPLVSFVVGRVLLGRLRSAWFENRRRCSGITLTHLGKSAHANSRRGSKRQMQHSNNLRSVFDADSKRQTANSRCDGNSQWQMASARAAAMPEQSRTGGDGQRLSCENRSGRKTGVESRNRNVLATNTSRLRLRRVGIPGPVNTKNLAKISYRDMFGNIQAQDSPESTQPKEPDVKGNARHQAEHSGDRHLEGGTFHGIYYGQIVSTRKESAGARRSEVIATPRARAGPPWQNQPWLFTITSSVGSTGGFL